MTTKPHDEQLQDLRDAVWAMFFSLGAALPHTQDVVAAMRKLEAAAAPEGEQ